MAGEAHDRPDIARDETMVAGETAGASSGESTSFREGAAATGTVLCQRWEIVGLLGAGGMGTVYRARDRELDETVALKMLHGEIASPAAVERFRREVKLARRVTHKNVARVHELGEHEGKRFFTMELVDGESLRALLERTGALPLARATDIARAMARGLAAAHEVGVVHRDMKPDNVLLGADGRVALTDFGIAASMEVEAADRTSSFIGTPLYMAPEQVDRSRPIDARTDLYAFGAVLYEMLTGGPPFRGETPLAIAVARLTTPPPDPRRRRRDLPDRLAELSLACMARDPDQRPANADAVLSALATQSPAVSILPSSIQAPSLSPSSVPTSPISVSSSAASVSSGSFPSPTSGGHWSRGPISETPFSTPKSGASLELPALQRAGTTRLAVLPIATAGDANDAFLAEGLTDDLIDGLSTIQKLHVLSRSVTARFGGRRDVDPRQVGAELGVDVVAEGSLRRAPTGRLRLSLRLIGAADALQLWSQRFDVTDAELLEVSDEAASAIAAALTVQMPRQARKLSDAHAIQLYMRARAAYREFSPIGAQRAVELFEDALAYAPDDPLLLSGHAIALARCSFFSGQRREEALEAARRAVELGPTSGEAHLAMSAASLQLGLHEDSLRYALDAVALAPSLAEAHQTVGRTLAEVGPIDVAIRFLETSKELDSTQVLARAELTKVLGLMGRWDDAAGGIQEVLHLSPSEGISANLVRARLATWRGDEDALRESNELFVVLRQKIPPTAPAAEIALLFAICFDDQQQLPTLEDLERLLGPSTSSRRNVFVLQLLTESACRRGLHDLARELLSRSVAAGLIDHCWLERCPLLGPLRVDPAAEGLIREVARRAEVIRAVLPRRPSARR